MGDLRSKEFGEGVTLSLPGDGASDDAAASLPAAKGASEIDEDSESLVGDLLGQFRVEARIGSGGLGVVYRAYDVKLKRQVALKVLSEGATRVERLLAEARSAAALTHASIAAIYDVQQVGGVAFLVMELVEGRTLRGELDTRTNQQLPVSEALSIAGDIAAAIARAHRHGIVHRDLKPENMVVTCDGADSHAKILDFGLARSVDDEEQGESRRVSGTRNYMAPEQAAGGVADARSDVFSFGVVLHEMLAGTRPFDVRTERHPRLWDASAWKRGPRLRALVPQIPVALERLVDRCLELDPVKRPADGSELVKTLDTIQRTRSSRRLKVTLALSALGAATLASVAVFAVQRAHQATLARATPPLTRSASEPRTASARHTLDASGLTWEVIDGEWTVDPGDGRDGREELIGRSGHLQTTSSLADGSIELDVRVPDNDFAVVGIGFRYSLTIENPRAQCGYGFNIRHDLTTATFLGEDGDWGPLNGGYRASPAMRPGWNHLAIHMHGSSFVIEANGTRIDAFTNVMFADGHLNLWARLGEVRFAGVRMVPAAPVDREVVER